MAGSVKVMLAGPGHEAVFYQMQPAFLQDARFTVSAHATQWALFEPGLSQMQPDLVIVQAELAPGPDALLPLLARMQAWNGVALVILPPALKDLLGVYKAAASVVRGVFISPVNWVEIAQAGFGAVMTERARLTSASPLQQALTQSTVNSYASGVTGTRRIAVLSHAGGAGCSTIAENLAYELAVRMGVRSLLLSLGLPPAAVPHLKLRYEPSLQEYFDRPGRAALQAAIQKREGLEVLLAPESSAVYLRADERARKDARDPAGLYALLLHCEDGNYAAVVMDTPAHEDTWTALPLVYANTVLVVTRPTLADCAAVRHTLEGLRLEQDPLHLRYWYNPPMPDTWRLLSHPPALGAWNMAVDEAILESTTSGTSLPTLRLYAWSPACLSLGYAQKAADVDHTALANSGWTLVRRPTGGRAVLHTDELTYSVIAAQENPLVAGTILESYSRLSQALLKALELLGLPARADKEYAARPPTQANGPVCFEVPSNYEITVQGKKLIGSAQARRLGGVLQHGSLPLYGDLTRITRVLVYPDESTRQTAAARLLEHATTVEAVQGAPLDWNTAAHALARAFQATFAVDLVPGQLSPLEEQRAAELVQEKYANPEWLLRI